jgi:hypothetical protein
VLYKVESTKYIRCRAVALAKRRLEASLVIFGVPMAVFSS